MLVVKVELISAIHPSRDKELARVVIGNIGGTNDRGEYKAIAYRGRGKAALDKSMRAAKFDETKHGASRHGFVSNYPRHTKHVLNLVARCLNAMGYK